MKSLGGFGCCLREGMIGEEVVQWDVAVAPSGLEQLDGKGDLKERVELVTKICKNDLGIKRYLGLILTDYLKMRDFEMQFSFKQSERKCSFLA